MCHLLETIKCLNGKLHNLDFHQIRFDTSRKKLFGCVQPISLSETIKLPPEVMSGLFRCRITYACLIEKTEFIPHNYKKIESLKLVYDNKIDYGFKYADRRFLDQLFDNRKDCDDILIVRNGCITDSYTANVLFFDGETWWTPDTPLLPGTRRASLLAEGKIRECRITPEDLHRFTKIGLINAMQDMDQMPVIAVNRLK